MNKFLKTCLIVGLICIVAGIAAGSAGIFHGGLPKLKEEVLRGEWSIGGDVEPFFELEEQQYFEEDQLIQMDMESTENSFSGSDIRELYVKSAGVSVKFTEHEGEDFLIEATKVHQYQAYVESGELYIIARGKSNNDLGEGIVNIAVPSEVLDAGTLDVFIKSAASVVELGRMEAEELELNVAAATISWNDLTVQDLDVEMAAGIVHGKNTLVMGSSEIHVSAGSMNLFGVLGLETDIEMTAGMVTIELADEYTDYNYDISCAGGSVTVGDHVSEGIAKTVEIGNNAPKNMAIECSMGAVNINFAN